MEKKARSSRRVPGEYDDFAGDSGTRGKSLRSQRGQKSQARRARTLADATDPRAPVQRREYDGYDGHGGHGAYGEPQYPGYPMRDEPPPSGSPHFTLPSMPVPASSRNGARRQGRGSPTWDEYARDGSDWEAPPDDGGYTTGRSRAQSVARPLTLARIEAPPTREEYSSNPRALMAPDSVPNLAAWQAALPVARKPVYTRAIETARRNPWSVSRIMLALIAVAVTLLISVTGVGEPSQPLMQFFNAQSASANAQSIADLVRPLTQGKLVEQYNSVAQYNEYWGAACSAAVLAEVLTAWGVRGATIGSMIDELGSYISPYGGLLSYQGFQQVAARHHMRSEFRENLTYQQMLYITNTLHLPLIVNVRISYGFYHFFSGGHFLVMTAGDSQGLRLVDSSLYYVKYMPLSVFNSMFTGRTVLLLPDDYVYSIPNV